MIGAPAAGLPRGRVVAIGGETMGTSWSARFVADDRADVAAIHGRIEARLDRLTRELSHWQPDSELCRFNRAVAGSWTVLPPDLFAVVDAGLEMAAISGGAFDPAIGRVVDLWGFGPPGPQPAPPEALLRTAHAAGGHARLQLNRAGSRLRQPGGLALDLSGIGKGHAVDALGIVLDRAGCSDWLVEIGGELKGRGMRPDGDPWWVDLERPPGLEPMPLRVALHGLAIATSGDYRRGAHTIDPRAGRPIDNDVASVSVLHPSAMWADAWATALTVLGPGAAPPLAEAHGIAACMLVRARGACCELLTPALRDMLAD